MTGMTCNREEIKKLEVNINKLRNIANEIKNASDSELNSKVNELEEFTYGLAWTRIFEDKWISESDILFWMLEFYAKNKDTEKCKYIAWMLNTYYKGYISEQLKKLINEEKYETCSLIKEFIK